MIDYSDLLLKRRSIRDFEDRAVEPKVVNDIIRESCLAPSSMNGQSWRFIVIMEKDLIRRLSDESKKNTLKQILEEPDSSRKGLISSLQDETFNVFYNAPCLVFIAGNKSSFRRVEDCTLSACYFMFSASARGLGTCWIGLGQNIKNPELRRIIGLPNDHEIIAPLILGYPKRIPPPPKREPHILKTISSQS